MNNAEWILSFDEPRAASTVDSIATVGGKGANLARLAQAGLPTPGGFFITTAAYRAFVAANRLEDRILAALPTGAMEDPGALASASDQIRGMFRAGTLPDRLAQEVVEAYNRMGCGPVAVRSSATAEDLPEMSFAGQQDTFLNVLGKEALLNAVIDCWSSLWTARAIGYRARNGVPQDSTALAVVVQRMVESQVSGVLFTANPLSGARTETVIDATYGLGEALVSGRVEPDHYVVDIRENRIKEKRLGAKALSIHGQAGGGTAEVTGERRGSQALPDEQILALAGLGQRVAQIYGSPQDIEWAWADDTLYLLQTRPITSLYPIPENMAADPLKVMFSFGAVQGMLDPITPLGRDLLRLAFAMGARLFGFRFTEETQTVVFSAGERLWINITNLMRNTVGRRLLRAALGMVEPGTRLAVEKIWDDPRLQPERKGITPRAMARILRAVLPIAWNMVLNMRAPERRREKVVLAGEELLNELRAHYAAIHGDARSRLAQQMALTRSFFLSRMPAILPQYVSLVAAGMTSFNLLRVLVQGLPETVTGKSNGGWPPLVLAASRGLPFNPTTEMDLALWRIAQVISRDERLAAEFLEQSPQQLARRYQQGEMPAAARQQIDAFLEKYGARGLAEIDAGRERWREAPLHIFEALSGYLRIEEEEQAPDAVFARSAREAYAAIDRLTAGLQKTRHGWLKARVARMAARRLRALLGTRESPKFFVVRIFDTVRAGLTGAGSELAASGALEQADDLFFLTIAEIEAFAAGEARDWRGLIARRRADFERETRRKQIPRLLLSDGRAFYGGIRTDGGGNGLSGSPVSPGSVEGRVRVVTDPRQANLLPGEIMVCPGTDPSWTPLFLTAAGLIMEVGGMMTHGAVVAREYGIPAVAGVDQATSRLKTGQRVRLDGFTGLIEPIDEQ